MTDANVVLGREHGARRTIRDGACMAIQKKRMPRAHCRHVAKLKVAVGVRTLVGRRASRFVIGIGRCSGITARRSHHRGHRLRQCLSVQLRSAMGRHARGILAYAKSIMAGFVEVLTLRLNALWSAGIPLNQGTLSSSCGATRWPIVTATCSSIVSSLSKLQTALSQSAFGVARLSRGRRPSSIT